MEGRQLANKYSPFPGDVVDAKLEPGEYVLNRNAVNAIGEDKLNKLNNEIAPRFQEGGMNFGPFKSEKAYRSNKRMQKKKAKNDRQIARLRAMRIKQMDKARGPAPELRRRSPEQFNPQSVKQGDVGEAPSSAELINYSRMKADSVHRDKMNSSIQGPSNIRRMETTPIDLQKVEVPMGDQFNSDEFNSMLGTAKIMNDYMIDQGMTDSQGRSPFNEDYGQIKGIDPKTFKMPTDRMLTPAEQLMAQMNMPRNQKMNTYIDEDNPEVEQIYKDNPLMEAQRLVRRQNLQEYSDDRTEKIKRDVALEYSPQALYNHDTDGIGGSKADAMQRQADRELLAEQNRDIEMMNPGGSPKKPINPKTGKPFETMEQYHSRMQEMIANQKKPAPLDIKDTSQPMDPITAVARKEIPKKKRGISNFLSDFAQGSNMSRYKTSGDRYRYQMGGEVGPDGKRRYALGALVAPLLAKGTAMFGAGQAAAANQVAGAKSGMANLLSAAKERYGGGFREANNMIAERYMSGKNSDGSNRSGDVAWNDMSVADKQSMAKDLSSNSKGLMNLATDQEKAQRLGMGLTEGATQVGKDVVGGTVGLAKGAVKTGLGAGAVALGGTALGAKAVYDGGKTLLKEGFNKDNEGGLISDAGELLNRDKAGNFGDVWSGKEKGSLMQRGRKGLGGLGMLLQDASQAQGFQGADWEGSGIGRYSNKDANDEAKKQTGIDNKTSGEVLDMENAGKIPTTEEVIGDNPVQDMQLEADNPDQNLAGTGVVLDEDNVVPASASTSGGNTNIFNKQTPPEISEDTPDWLKEMSSDYKDPNAGSGVLAPNYDPNAPAPEFNVEDLTKVNIGGGQTGGRVSLEGFIQQSWRNMR